MASISVSGLNVDLCLERTLLLTLCLETCVCEIVRLGASFADLQLGFLEVFPFLILLFCTRSHLLAGGRRLIFWVPVVAVALVQMLR